MVLHTVKHENMSFRTMKQQRYYRTQLLTKFNFNQVIKSRTSWLQLNMLLIWALKT